MDVDTSSGQKPDGWRTLGRSIDQHGACKFFDLIAH